MGKFLMWVVILAAAYLAWRLLVVSKRRVDRSRDAAERAERERHDGDGDDGAGHGDKAGRLRAPEAMMQCAVCGLHLPGSEAVFARGRVYCSAEHRDQDEAAQRAPTGRPGP